MGFLGFFLIESHVHAQASPAYVVPLLLRHVSSTVDT